MKTFLEWLQLLEASQIQYITSDDYIKRLRAIGWTVSDNKGSHVQAISPGGIGTVTWSSNNWERNWQKVAGDLLRRSRSSTSGFPDLDFVWKSKFEIPSNFNVSTQEIARVSDNPVETIIVAKLLSNLEYLTGKEINYKGIWKHVKLADVGNDGMSIEVLFDNLEDARFSLDQTLSIRNASVPSNPLVAV